MNTHSKKTILIVEDDLVISATLRELLVESDYNVITAFNGAEALNTLRSIENPSLILLDLMMPIMDGLQFREIQLSDPSLKEIPVVIMSADRSLTEKKAKLSAKEYLKKPLDIYQLLEVIENFVS